MHWLVLAALVAGLLVPGPLLRADQSKIDTKAVLAKTAPETVEELKAFQEHVKTVLKKVMPTVVAVQVGGAQGSGVIVSKEGHILTAAHVSGRADQNVVIILPDGKRVKGKTFGANRNIDSGMIKITSEGTWPFAEMGNSKSLKKGQWCLAIGHPGGFKPGRTPVVRVGRVLDNLKSFVRTDCALVGGDSGGPMFDMEGKVIAIHSRIGPRMTSNIHVPVDTYRKTWDRLVKSEVWGSGIGGRPTNQAYLGIQADLRADNCKIQMITSNSPAEKAGLKPDDIITKFAGKEIQTFSDLRDTIAKKKPGDKVSVEVLRGDQKITVEVVLAKRED